MPTKLPPARRGDLRSLRWIIFKAGLFLAILLLSLGLVMIVDPWWQRGLLGLGLIWSSARLYYFCFYVIESYIDPSYRFDGLGSALRWLWSRR